MGRKKVTVVGSGHVGATVAQKIAERELADVVLIDILPGVPQGKALDMAESGPVERFNMGLMGTNDYADTAGSDMVVITAGLARKPGMSRDDLAAKNAEIVGGVASQAFRHSPNAMFLVVTNPMDVMTYVTAEVTDLPKPRVFGMGGVLDSARFSTFVSRELNVSIENVHTFVLGGHGDLMLPMARYSTVAGVPLPDLIPADRLEAIIQRTRDGGAEIVNLLQSGSAYYAPGAAVAEMIEAVFKDKKKILPCAAWLTGQYGFEGVYTGVPAKLGAGGVESIVEIPLSPEEKKAFAASVAAVRDGVGRLGGVLAKLKSTKGQSA